MRPIIRQYAKLLNTSDTVIGSCKKEKNIDKFHNRTAGMFYVFRPCGIRLSNYEMYTSESLSDVFLYLIDTFGEEMNGIRGVVYDRACGLHPFIKRLSGEGNNFAKKYETLDFIIDIFHVEKHTQLNFHLSKCI